MSDEKVIDEVLDKVDKKKNVLRVVEVVKFQRRKMLFGSLAGADDYGSYNPIPVVDYPPSVTDQTHAQRLSQQVKVGAAQMEDMADNQFDFAAGQKDDGRAADVAGLTLERLDPAERAEMEYNNSVRIQNELQQQVAKRRADEAAKVQQAQKAAADKVEKGLQDTQKAFESVSIGKNE